MTTTPDTISFEFTEDMKGFVTFGETNFEDGYEKGKKTGDALMFHLTKCLCRRYRWRSS